MKRNRIDIPIIKSPKVKRITDIVSERTQVLDLKGNHIGILYTDYFPRASKRGGAWMDAFRKQSKENGKFIHPLIYNVGNFSKPTTKWSPVLKEVMQLCSIFMLN